MLSFGMRSFGWGRPASQGLRFRAFLQLPEGHVRGAGA